jgi:hypothetical protein
VEHDQFLPRRLQRRLALLLQLFYNDARARRLGWSGRNATQLHYDPFGQPRRAERQEFSDALAEATP